MNWFICYCTLTYVFYRHVLRLPLHKNPQNHKVDTQWTILSTMLLCTLGISKSEYLFRIILPKQDTLLHEKCSDIVYFSSNKQAKPAEDVLYAKVSKAKPHEKVRYNHLSFHMSHYTLVFIISCLPSANSVGF